MQALILTPTREIALQVAAVLRVLAAEVPGLVVGTLIGGLPIEDDQKLLRRCFHESHCLTDLGQCRDVQAWPTRRAAPRVAAHWIPVLPAQRWLLRVCSVGCEPPGLR